MVPCYDGHVGQPTPIPPDRIPGNWGAVTYGRTGLILLAIGTALLATGLALSGSLSRVVLHARAFPWGDYLLSVAVPVLVLATGFLLTRFLGPRWFPRRRPRSVCRLMILAWILDVWGNSFLYGFLRARL